MFIIDFIIYRLIFIILLYYVRSVFSFLFLLIYLSFIAFLCSRDCFFFYVIVEGLRIRGVKE